MQDVSPESPEERAKRPGKARRVFDRHIGPGSYSFEIVKRVAYGVYTDGFIHAGNLAYLALLTLFPFFIVAAAVARLLGRTGDGLHTVNAFLNTVPPSVAQVLQQPIHDVLVARSGTLLWLGAIVGLWTTASFIETIRDILRRAYGTHFGRPFWEYRLGSIGLIIGSVILAMMAFSFQVALLGIEQFVVRVLPFASNAATALSIGRLAPAFALFVALYILFYTLTPRKYREAKCPKWPGAALTTGWWLGTTAALPGILGMLGGYDRTYGSLAGVMIALIFFFFVGLGVVVGAQLNAALAETPATGLEDDQGNPIVQEKAAT
ncbi:YihY/virulence factor BrkB family protein [soil metagenome]